MSTNSAIGENATYLNSTSYFCDFYVITHDLNDHATSDEGSNECHSRLRYERIYAD